MNVEIENAPNCEVTLRIELPAERVDTEWKNVVSLFARQAKLPGFRPGKAPRAIVESKYGPQIREELTERLTSTALREAIKEKELKVLGVRSVQDNEVGADRIFRCVAVCIVEPEFSLPEYKGLAVSVPDQPLTEQAVDEAMENLRAPHANFNPITDRALAEGDFAVLTYSGALNGQPLKELLPEAQPLVVGRNGFWVEIKGDAFLPGFLPAIQGMQVGETRTVPVTFPEEFTIEELKGKQLEYTVTLDGINERVLPELSDELAAQIYPGKTLAELRDFVREQLEKNAEQEKKNQKVQKVIDALMSACDFTPPEAMVAQEAHSTLREIIAENQSRGVPEETLKAQTESIVDAAQHTAAGRVKLRFILSRIAEQEKIKVNEAELLQRIAEMSARYEIPPKKLVQDLKKRNAIGSIQEDILVKKALDFVCEQATVTA